MRKPWRPEEDKYLRTAYQDGVAGPLIAEHLGRSVDGIHDRASRLGLRHAGSTILGYVPAELPTLEYVPHIKPGQNSKYQMRAAP